MVPQPQTDRTGFLRNPEVSVRREIPSHLTLKIRKGSRADAMVLEREIVAVCNKRSCCESDNNGPSLCATESPILTIHFRGYCTSDISGSTQKVDHLRKRWIAIRHFLFPVRSGDPSYIYEEGSYDANVRFTGGTPEEFW